MDKSALKDKRRETVIGLLKGMSIRKDTDGGFEKDDVYGCIQELCNLYEDHITELESNYEAEISELTKRYQKYDENNELYVSLILEAKKSSNEIINQAKTEVDEILKNGKEKIRVQEEQLEQFRADSEKERESIAEELKASKEVAEAEKAAMKVEMEAEKEKLEATKNKYRQQITAMEDEFAEIKTNILRTSARLDSLKAQTEELSPSIDWEVEETDIEVEVPDDEIENIKGRPLFVYTDGLNEAENPAHEQFGDDRLLTFLRNCSFESSRQVILDIAADVEKHRNGAEPNDDLTMMCLNIKVTTE